MINKNMKKIKYISLLVIATLLLSACGKEKINESVDINEEANNVEVNEKKSLKELLGVGVSQKCTFEMDEEGQATKGEILIKGDKFKQSLEMMTPEGLMKVHTISDGEYFYSWNEGIEGSGTKMKIEKEEEMLEEEMLGEESSTEADINWEEKLDYKCEGVEIGDEDLALPTDIEFMDLSEMIDNLQNMSPEELQNLVPSEE